MHTRIVKTNFWRDGKVAKLSKNSTLLLMYLITNEYINLCGLYELPDAYMMLQSKLSQDELSACKKEIEETRMAFFYEGWIYLPNSVKHNKYNKSPKTMTAYRNQVESIPNQIKDKFKELYDSTMHSSMDSVWIPIENINKKTENRKQKEEIIKQTNTITSKMDMNEAINPEDIPF